MVDTFSFIIPKDTYSGATQHLLFHHNRSLHEFASESYGRLDFQWIPIGWLFDQNLSLAKINCDTVLDGLGYQSLVFIHGELLNEM